MEHSNTTTLLNNYLDLFEPHILERAAQYYQNGDVSSFEGIAPDLWHGVVCGTTDYDVDVRIHNGRVLSAGCSCPYGQKHMYCKHVGALLMAIDHYLNQPNGALDPRTMEMASRPVFQYWSNLVGITELCKHPLEEQDWHDIRRILERLSGFPDPHPFMDKVRLDRFTGDHEGHAIRPHVLNPEYFKDLAHGWLTILEAAYEHLEDSEGLRRLYILYILLAKTKQDAIYIRALRDLSGEYWKDDLRTIVELAHEYRFMFNRCDNPVYEKLLREEQLVDAAAEYVAGHLVGERMLRSLSLVAKKNPDRSLVAIGNRLRQPECELYQGDKYAVAHNVGMWIQAIDRTFGAEPARELSRWILAMFPRRTLLHEELKGYTDD